MIVGSSWRKTPQALLPLQKELLKLNGFKGFFLFNSLLIDLMIIFVQV